MKLADTNVWLALTLSKHVFHEAAQVWLAGEPASRSVMFCRATQHSFLRLLTTQAVMSQYGLPPLTNAEAWTLYERFLADGRVAHSEEPAGIEAHWKLLASRDTASPKMWMDAYLAAFAIAGGHQLVTTDRDFQQYAGLNCLLLTSV